MLFEFSEFELDLERYELRRAGKPVPLQPRIFDVISYLVENRERVVGKEELLDALWHGEHVNETAVPWAISRARKALRRSQHGAESIATVRGRGYRFVECVRRVGGSKDAPSSDASISRAPVEFIAQTVVPFIGRDAELGRLAAALDDARGGRGALLVVAGDAGMGKTRLAREFAAHAALDGVPVWSGICIEGGKAAPFWPWVQVLRDAAKEPALAREAEALIDELVPSTPEDHSRINGARFWRMERMCKFFVESTSRGARLAVIDDLHWADDASIELLTLLSLRLSRTQLLVVALTDDGAACADATPRAASRIGASEVITLRALSLTDIQMYANLVLGAGLAPNAAELLLERSGGNPLFLQDSLLALANGEPTSSSSADLTRLLSSARDVLHARVKRLPANSIEALQAASVLGAHFQLNVLRRMLDATPMELAGRLEPAISARLLATDEDPASCRFVHDAIRHAIYEQLPISRRLELHARAADAIQAEPEVAEATPRAFPYHLYRSLPHRDPALVERCAREAAQSAMARSSYDEAVELYEWAMHALSMRDGATPRERCELLVELAWAFRNAGRKPEARKCATQAILLARTEGDADLLLSAARCLRARMMMVNYPDAMALLALEDALRLSTDDRTRAGALGQLACIPPHSLDVSRSQELAREAEALARATGSSTTVMDALISRLATLSGPADVKTLVPVSHEILRGPVTPGDADRADAVLACFYAYSLEARREPRDYMLSEVGRLGRRLRQPERTWLYKRLTAAVALGEGRFAEAKIAFDELHADAQRLALPYGDLYRTAYLIEWGRAQAGFEQLLRVGSHLFSQWLWASSLPTFQAIRAWLLWACGLRAEAKLAFESLASVHFADVPQELSYLHALTCLAEMAIGLEDTPRAAVLFELLEPFREYCAFSRLGFHRGPVALHLGQLATFLGRHEDATAYLESGLGMSSRMGWIPDMVRCQLALARALPPNGLAAARRRRRLLIEAYETAKHLGMGPLLSQIELVLPADLRRRSPRNARAALESSARFGRD
jgi:DNA-binding winged helix-turn-helix (wHTH) protein/tetratricopeptide (TPR) repeat protein